MQIFRGGPSYNLGKWGMQGYTLASWRSLF